MSRKALTHRIHGLGPTEHEEIFKILKAAGVNHTQNQNGVFINLSSVDDAVVDRIRAFVEFCYENKRKLDEYDKRLNECKITQRFDDLPRSSEASDVATPSTTNAGGGGDGGTSTTAQAPATVHGGDGGARAQTHASSDAEASDPTATAADRAAGQAMRERLLRMKERVAMDVERATKRKACSKFATAKKKFAKKRTASFVAALQAAADEGGAEGGGSGGGELQPEAYDPGVLLAPRA